MVEKLTREAIAENAIMHDSVPGTHQPTKVHRTFDLPPSIYAATVACYLGFMAITALAFSSPELILPMAVMAFSIIAGFGINTIWTRLAPKTSDKALSWGKFERDGIQTLTGRNTAGQATVQVLILPALLLVWGLAVVTIAAIVR